MDRTHIHSALLGFLLLSAAGGTVPFALGETSSAAAVSAAPLPWGDQGDGTYRNPILPADYSDPDVIRVGGDFYLVASEFHFVGLQVLHSRDLVNWRIIGQVFDRLAMDPKYDAMQGYAQGTWAPSLRFHDGLFYLYVCTPRDGLFCWTARNPAGPWSEMVAVKVVADWEDPCPFWDDDGQAYLIHGVHRAGPLILHKLNAGGTRLLDDGVEVYRGPVAEGPKLFKRHGWYFISLPEGGVEPGGQTVLRSRNLYGPYERREVLPAGSPHQGGLVELDNGEAWFIGFKSAGHLGRVTHLLPVRWGEDDWPVFGDNGQPVTQWKKPGGATGGPVVHPQTSDEFGDAVLQPQWQWNHNPLAGAWSLTDRPGWLRLHGQPAPELVAAHNSLTQKLWGDSGVAEVKLDGRGLSDGQRAGLAFMCGKVFNTVGLVRTGGVCRISWDGGTGPEVPDGVIWLRAAYRGDQGRLAYSLAGASYVDTGLVITLKFGQWKGARLALVAFGDGGGAADFDYFHLTHGREIPQTAPKP